MLPLILENADFRPPTHVSSGCQWLVASSVLRGPEAQLEIPNSRRSPDSDSRFGRESGRESPIPDSAKIGKRGIPDSRFGGNQETGNPPFPDSAGTGNRGPDGGGPGISWSGYKRIQSSKLYRPSKSGECEAAEGSVLISQLLSFGATWPVFSFGVRPSSRTSESSTGLKVSSRAYTRYPSPGRRQGR
jgi:hypothetical protein